MGLVVLLLRGGGGGGWGGKLHALGFRWRRSSCVLRRMSCTFRGSEDDVAFVLPFSPRE